MANKPILILPNAKNWMGTKVTGATKTKMTAYYGSFPQGFWPGITWHFPTGGGIASYGSWPTKPVEARVDRTVKDMLAMTRNARNGYLYIDFLGNIHQDVSLKDKTIHGNSLNSKGGGCEISSPGLAFADKEGEYHAAYKFKTWSESAAKKKSMVGYHSIPLSQLNMVKKQTQETKAGVYVKYQPQQVRALFQTVFDLVWCDQGNGIFKPENQYGHSMVCTKKDPGGSLYLTISQLREVGLKMTKGLALPDFNSPKVFQEKLNEFVLKDERYLKFYEGFIDYTQQIPTWL